MLVLLHKVVKVYPSSASFLLLVPNSQLAAGNTYRAGCPATMCCPHLCHVLGEQVLLWHAGKVCGAVSSCRQVTRSLCWINGCLAAVLWDIMCMVLLSWGVGIAFPSHCCAAVSAGDPLILLFSSSYCQAGVCIPQGCWWWCLGCPMGKERGSSFVCSEGPGLWWSQQVVTHSKGQHHCPFPVPSLEWGLCGSSLVSPSHGGKAWSRASSAAPSICFFFIPLA